MQLISLKIFTFSLKIFCIISLILGLFTFSCVSYAADLTGVNVIDKNQLVLRFNSPFKYHYFYLSSPDRLVIDFDQTGLKTNTAHLALGGLPIRSVRTSMSAQKTLRVVFDLAYKVKKETAPRINILAASGNEPWRLKLTFGAIPGYQKNAVRSASPVSKAPIKLINTNTTSTTSVTKYQPVYKSPVSAKPAVINAQARYHPHTVIVVIDAGHGGKDPGAHGRYGTREKDVVLGIARQLHYLISREPGLHSVLTRSGDYFIDLRQRLKIARNNSADLFVSIHADAFSNAYSHGASVYALSQRGGTSEAARWLAAKENYSELGGVNLGELDDDDGMVRSVLIDLSQTATIGASLDLGGGVLRNMGQMTRLHHNRVEQAQFVVLKSLDIPSILVETGFISNPQEEANLKNPRYQTQLARAILLGIKSYLKQHPSTGDYGG